MKKFFVVFALLILFFAVSCGGSQNAENDDNTVMPDDSVDENTEISDDDNEQSDDIENSRNQNDEDQEEMSDTTEEDDEDIDSAPAAQTQYNSPYGSVSFDFTGYVGAAGYTPGCENDFLFSGTYGNNSTSILPEDLTSTLECAYQTSDDFFSEDIRGKYIFIKKQFITVSAGYYYDNPLISFSIPIELAAKEGVHDINYSYKDNVVLLISDVDWDAGVAKGAGECIHAFAEGEIEITKGFIDGENEFSFRGEATLYNPLNYKGDNISATPSLSDFLIGAVGTDKICDPID
ncbi:hypothetical protein J6Y50_05130 [bacterium]|nr:hypothetical protein [bacterium]